MFFNIFKEIILHTDSPLAGSGFIGMMCSAVDTQPLNPEEVLQLSVAQFCGLRACLRKLDGLESVTLESVVSNASILRSKQISYLTIGYLCVAFGGPPRVHLLV